MRHRPALVIAALLAVLVVVAIVAATIGSAGIPWHRLLAAAGLGAGDPGLIARDQLVLWSIRLPRIAVAAMVERCSPPPAPSCRACFAIRSPIRRWSACRAVARSRRPPPS